EQPAGRAIDAVDDLDRLRGQIQEARLEPVQRLDAEHDAAVGGVLGEAAQLSHEEIDVPRAFVARLQPEPADGTVERTDAVPRAERVRRVDAVPNVSDAIRSDRLVRMDEIAVRTHHRAYAGAEAVFSNHRGRAAVIEIARALDRDLDEIEAKLRDVPCDAGE